MKCPTCRADNPETVHFCPDCGTRLDGVSFTKTLETPSGELVRGTVFAGRYEIIEELGAGGMGRVYRAYDKKIEEEVALKLIRPEIAAEKRTVERFRNEIKTARKITHKNVCRTHDLGEEGKALFITMEYVRGEDLKSLIRRTKQLAPGTAVAIARQVAEGLGEAHRLGVVHRDLKPGNIMIDKEGSAKIMDFGIARSLLRAGTTAEGAVIGTPEYMSPEQVEGKPADVRADIYALGVILFEMVTGRPPFEGETALAVAHKHKYEPAPDARTLKPQLPVALGRLILRSMEKEREKRYQTTTEFLVDLEAVEAMLPTAERVPGRAPSRTKPATSKTITVKITPRKLVIPAVLLILFVIAAVSFWHPWRGREISAAPPRIDNSIAVISFENLTGDPRHDGLVRAVPNLMITKLEEMGIPYVASWERLRDLLKQMGRDPDVPIDKEAGFELCRREGIAVLVTGEITKAGSVFVTNIKALDAGTKGSLASASSQGQSEESILISQIDELAGRVYQKLDWPLVNIGDIPPVAEFTTASMEAYNNFLRGKDELERYNYANARGFLEKAVGVDPNFASAYRLLSRAHQMLGNVSAQSESLKKAVSLSSRASEKERLYISAAAAAGVENKIEAYQRIITKYPREKEAYYWLGFHYQNIDLGKAVDFEEKAIGLDPSYRPAVNQLGCYYLALGAYDKGIEWLKRYLALSPGDANPLDSLGAGYFGAGDLDEAIGKFKEALDIDPYFFGIEWKIAYIYALKEDYQEAMRWLDRGAALKTSAAIRSHSLRMRAFFHHWLGESDKALIDLERASEEAASTELRTLESSSRWLRAWLLYERGDVDAGEKQRKAFEDYVRESPHSPAMVAFDTCFYMGLCALKRSQVDSASDYLSKMKALLPDVPRLAARSSYYQAHCDILEGEIKIAAKAPERAVVICEKTAPWINLVWSFLSVRGSEMGDYLVPFQKDTLARAYREAGAIDEAIAEYERLITFNPKRGEQALIHPKYRYRLAQLYEARGERAKAAAEYRKFLDIWRNAEPGLQEVEDAKKRLASLI